MRLTLRAAALSGILSIAAQWVMPIQPAAAYEPLNGDGSSWAAPAIDQWSRDVRSRGIVINYNADGSAAGRNNYLQNQSDFASTDIQYLTKGDPFGGGVETPAVAYSYIPIVAGGTAFLYNLSVGGRKITDLRLSGDTLTKIFTGQITNWDDARITHDYGRPLPSEKITVITRSDGSGATYQFTRWMATQYTSQWDSFCAAHGGPPRACGPTEFYPGFSGSQQRNGSDQVANYVSASYGAGSIAYDEYAYALESNIPVVKVLNTAGYYALPTPSNVAIALQKAVIDENPASLTFLIQNLDHVYTNPDPRTYPLSSYSYLIVPRAKRVINGTTYGPPSRFDNARGNTLSSWLNYVLCGAQQTAGQLGYSPLPKNLVVGGFMQANNIPGHIPSPDLTQLNNCNNPTYHNGINYLVRDAPFPSPCDKAGASLTCSPTAPATSSSVPAPTTSQQPTSGASAPLTITNPATTAPAGTGGATTPATSQPVVPVATAAPSTSATVDPDTGQTVGATQVAAGAGQQQIYAEPVALTGRSGGNGVFGVLAAIEILAAVLIPGAIGARLARRRRSAP